MNPFTRAVHAMLLVGATLFVALACLALWDVHRELRHFDQTITDTNRNLAIIGVAAGEIQKGARAWEQSSKTQAADADAVLQTATGALGSMRSLLDGMEQTNTAIAAAIAHQDSNLTIVEGRSYQAVGDLSAALGKMQQLEETANATAGDIAKLAASPDLAAAIAQFDQGMVKMNSVLASLDGMAASGNRDAAMLEAKLREALKPATLAKSIFMRALGLAGPAAEVATAVK